MTGLLWFLRVGGPFLAVAIYVFLLSGTEFARETDAATRFLVVVGGAVTITAIATLVLNVVARGYEEWRAR